MYSAAERAISTNGRDNVLGLSKDVLDDVQRQPSPSRKSGRFDQVLYCDTHFQLGFTKNSPLSNFGSVDRAFGTAGSGGSNAFADPSSEMSFAYVQNNAQPVFLADDPREWALRVRAYECIAKLREAQGLSAVSLESVRKAGFMTDK